MFPAVIVLGNMSTFHRHSLAAKGGLSLLIAGALLVFPKLALGLSGFETGVSVMPLISGGEADRGHKPRTDSVHCVRLHSCESLFISALHGWRRYLYDAPAHSRSVYLN